MYLKKGDTVLVRTGKDRGKTGKILKVLKDENKVVVEGVNMAKRRRAGRRGGQKGQVVEMTLPVNASNVSLLGKDNKPTRISIRKTEKGRERIAKKGGAVIS